MTVPIALTVAGSDSGGGAGIQADLKTFEALGVYGASVLTAVAAQNTLAVSSIHEVPSVMVRDQLRAVLSDLPPAAVKVGMLGSVPLIRLVAQELRKHGAPVVLDPVMVGKSGARLLRPAALHALVRLLLPGATVITPSIPEAEILIGAPIQSEADAKAAARRIQELGPRAVLLKGGYRQGDRVMDGFLDGRTWHRFEGPRLQTTSTHGSGCTLASAIAAYLARGETLPDAVEKAIRFVRLAIEHAPGLGAGRGPLGHRAAGFLLRDR